ncbi:MAG TPA: SDR family NAD(P)-dependent oxidoreductase [Saprospiraceae bacterium]|nr:SDR family NAD(P)-dependent oxidoreductase [Saprospiraceae bacterium]
MLKKYRNALVTGGSSGIGLEIVKQLAYHEVSVCLIALPDEELVRVSEDLRRQFPSIQIEVLGIDLTLDNAADRVFEFCKSKNFYVDILINNAGFGTYGWMTDILKDKELAMINLHVLTLYKLTRLFLEEMLKNDNGIVVNISSISAFQPNPRLATYGATKAFVYQWSRAINEELKAKGEKVRVLVVCPTPVRTAFIKKAGMEKSSLFKSWMVVEQTKVAEAVLGAIENSVDMIIPGRRFHWLHKFISRLPESWRVKLADIHLREKN